MTPSRKIPNVAWIVFAFAAGAVTAIGLYSVFGADGDDAANGTIVQPGAPGEPSRELSDDELADIEPPTYNQADVGFMQGMIHHHGQALAMTALVADRTENDDITLMAERIETSQEAEIEQMEDWLAARDEEVPEANVDHAHHGDTDPTRMPGMLTEAQFAQLTAATDAEFDRTFLELMIQHHEGAMVMVTQLFADGGGLESESTTLAGHIEADQEIEIGRMRDLLATFASVSG